jgi:hypothetical protein
MAGYTFNNFTAASRKPNLVLFGLFNASDNISWINAASTNTQPYSTSTITASPMTILATTHGQGTLAFGKCFDASGNEILANWQRNSSGDLTITYLAAPTQINIYP